MPVDPIMTSQVETDVAVNRLRSFDQWYLVHTQVGREAVARVNLERQGYGVFLPLQQTSRRHGRTIRTFDAAFFPGYLFVAFDAGKTMWRPINGTFGVKRLVTFGMTPALVPQAIIETLLDRADPMGRLMPGHQFAPGDRVRITAGPFAGQLGQIDTLSGAERVRLLLEWMQQSVRVEMNKSGVEPVRAAG